ncbi:MAG: recombination mediator RecR [Candidatus Eisenbacteria bacterium]
MYGSKILEQLIEELVKLPTIGQKSAQRLALHLLRAPREDALRLADSIRELREKVGFCGTCGNFSETDPCPICTDSRRDGSLICVVEQPGDVIAFERTGQFRGRYHVLGGALSPLDGTTPETLRIRELLERLRPSAAPAAPVAVEVREGAPAAGREAAPVDGRAGVPGEVREVILATNPNVAGEATALYLIRLLAPIGIPVTRIARGVPMGSDLEYSDLVTLARALEGRQRAE